MYIYDYMYTDSDLYVIDLNIYMGNISVVCSSIQVPIARIVELRNMKWDELIFIKARVVHHKTGMIAHNMYS